MIPAALPPVDPAVLPPAVRDGGDDDRALYRAALGFERMLLAEMLAEVPLAGAEETAGPYAELLPQTLADSLAAHGGIGLAPELHRSLAGVAR